MTDQTHTICSLYREGMGVKDIGRLLQRGNKTISSVLHREGVELRQCGFASRQDPTEEEIEQHKQRILKQRGIILRQGMLADAY